MLRITVATRYLFKSIGGCLEPLLGLRCCQWFRILACGKFFSVLLLLNLAQQWLCPCWRCLTLVGCSCNPGALAKCQCSPSRVSKHPPMDLNKYRVATVIRSIRA